MEKIKIKTVLKILVTFIFAGLLTVSAGKEYKKSMIKRLNNFLPKSYDYLYILQERKVDVNKISLRRYENYYKVSTWVLNSPESWALLGFCRYNLGKNGEAIKYMKRAIDLDPHFFWYYYDLGLLYYKEGMYEKAEDILEKAVKEDPVKTLKTISSSKEYLRILFYRKFRHKISFQERLKEGYENALGILILSKKKVRNEQVLNLKLKIF